ncbi:hypothetical protein HMPREF9318_00733 [Streptococcus urinalis FB127-CNA-2]|uniref:Sensory transduction protein LytT n=1 Tax=Streptococcus urinalis 2285-97 TaxID=764291 RepID=G5KHH8_9STRE|nr:LytTR family transcriptional regulator DNA-binding domain-containing protein [Streptococcus urinalis]EHJ57061.1 sensory transduction protein LytT [Streptococcus urinalis 2285-97]EKS22535.1 hypothetical protein HMPREF9318_00733 [Streptococcus urinalis FB127-CNA-2]VEF32348.1 Autolysis response regulater LytR [Streptococcus urinalis]
MNILIVDDEPLARNELTFLLKRFSSKNQINEASNIREAQSCLLQEQYDLVFIDIHLGKESGMTLAKIMNQMKKPPKIIFATAYDQYALEAFEQNAQDYLLKPYDYDRLCKSLEKVTNHIQKSKSHQESRQVFSVCYDEKVVMVKKQEIISIEAMQGKTILYTPKTSFYSDQTLQKWLSKLPKDQFLKVHRSYIINIREIKTIEPWFNQTLRLHMSNHQAIPVSRSHVKMLKSKLDF